MEEIQMHLEEADELMNKTLSHTEAEVLKIRAGKAMPNMLDGLTVQYYGADTPLNQVASVTTPDARTLLIKPFENKLIGEIEKAIINSDLGLNPQNDGEVVRLSIPPLTEERRTNLVKQVKAECEQGKISVRNIRKDTNESLRKLQKEGASEDEVKRAETKVQELTDAYTKKLDAVLEKKEKEIMTI
ncbi:MAG: ribosome recycling factor [Cyclobacteriaceae bacterium]|nr:ribosome recycling factor [Cyclobacteriaceae bacterium]MCH8516185.1 ribosome recycling factor [Cyclobacteriaceae bacterium]